MSDRSVAAIAFSWDVITALYGAGVKLGEQQTYVFWAIRTIGGPNFITGEPWQKLESFTGNI